MWIVGFIIGLIVIQIVRQAEIKENLKGCVYDEKTKCWHRIM